MNTWCWFQLSILLIIISYFFGNIAYINSLNSSFIYLYGTFIFLFVYALTDLMDRNKSALIFELLKNSFGLSIIYIQNDWFGSSLYTQGIPLIMINYLVLSSVITAWFVFKNVREDKLQTMHEEQIMSNIA